MYTVKITKATGDGHDVVVTELSQDFSDALEVDLYMQYIAENTQDTQDFDAGLYRDGIRVH